MSPCYARSADTRIQACLWLNLVVPSALLSASLVTSAQVGSYCGMIHCFALPSACSYFGITARMVRVSETLTIRIRPPVDHCPRMKKSHVAQLESQSGMLRNKNSIDISTEYFSMVTVLFCPISNAALMQKISRKRSWTYFESTETAGVVDVVDGAGDRGKRTASRCVPRRGCQQCVFSGPAGQIFGTCPASLKQFFAGPLLVAKEVRYTVCYSVDV